jgi:hypothetical protein
LIDFVRTKLALQKPQEVGFSFCKNWMRRKLGFSFGFLAEEEMGFFICKTGRGGEYKLGFFSFAKTGRGGGENGFFLLKKLDEEEDQNCRKKGNNNKNRQVQNPSYKEKKGKTHVQTALVMTEICYREKETVAEGSLAAEEEEEEDVKNQSLHNPLPLLPHILS